MAATTKNILIFGATGLIGQHITNAILSNKDKFERIVIFTSPNTIWTKSDEIDQLKARGAEIIAGEITSEQAVTEAYSGIDTVVSCVGRPVIHTQLHVIEWADKHPDVKRVSAGLSTTITERTEANFVRPSSSPPNTAPTSNTGPPPSMKLPTNKSSKSAPCSKPSKTSPTPTSSRVPTATQTEAVSISIFSSRTTN